MGILLAPDKGSETRKKIYQKGDSYVGGLEDKWNDLVEEMGHKFEKIRTDATRMVETATTKAADMEKNTVSAAKETAKDAKTHFSNSNA